MDGYETDSEVISTQIKVRQRSQSTPPPMVVSGSVPGVLANDMKASKKSKDDTSLTDPELAEEWQKTQDELKALRVGGGADDKDVAPAPDADKTVVMDGVSAEAVKQEDNPGGDGDGETDGDGTSAEKMKKKTAKKADDGDDDDGGDDKKEMKKEEEEDDEEEDDEDDDDDEAPPVLKRRLGSAVPLFSRVEIEREEEEGEDEEEEEPAVVAARAEQARLDQLRQQYTQSQPENQWADRLEHMGSVDSLRQLKAGDKTELDRAAEDAIEVRNKIRQSFSLSKTTGAKTQRGKREAFAHKKELYDSAEAQQWRTARERGQQSFRGTKLFGLVHSSAQQPQAQDQPQAAAPAAFTAGQLSDMKDMQDCPVDFMNYTDDVQFVKYFPKNYQMLETFAGLEKALEGHDPEEDIPNLGKVKDITKKVAKYSRVLDFYRSKMDIISSPFYMVLSQEDLSLRPNELAQRIMSCRETRPEFAEYLEAVYRLKVLEAQGVVRDFKGAGLKRIERAGGMDKKHRRYIAFGTYENSVKTELSAGFSGESWQGDYTGEYLGESKYRGDPDKWGKYGFKARVSHEYRVRAVEGGFSLDGDLTEDKKSKARLSGSFSAGEAYIRGSIGAAMALDQKDTLEGYVGLDEEIGASAVKGRITGSLGRSMSVLGEDITAIGGELDANISLLEGRAAIFGKAGRFKIHNPDTDEDEIHEGFAAGVDAHAALVSGSVKGSLHILGVKIGVKATGELGAAGITAGFYATSKKIGLSFGAMLGLGGKIDLDVDFSAWTEWASKQLLKLSVKHGHNPLELGMKKYERDKYRPEPSEG